MSFFELSKEDEQRANAAAGSTLAMLFRGGAVAWSAVGKGVKITTDATAGGLRKVADLVESGGNTTADFCERRSKSCVEKALKYSGFSEDDVLAAMEAMEIVKDVKAGQPPKFSPMRKVEASEHRDGRAPVDMLDVEPA